MGRPNRDVEYLRALRRYHSVHGALPSYAQMSSLLKFKAKYASQRLVHRLEEAGFVERAPGGRLAPGPRFHELPLVDEHVPAGLPEPSQPAGGVSFQSLDRLLIDKPDQTVLVRVRGDSMIDAGVLDGDTAVVVRDSAARSGDFVIARIDGAYTLKELRIERGKPALIPHNKAYRPTTPTSAFEVVGVVTGIVRRLGGRPDRTQRTQRT